MQQQGERMLYTRQKASRPGLVMMQLRIPDEFLTASLEHQPCSCLTATLTMQRKIVILRRSTQAGFLGPNCAPPT
jgi:hypothetical protein